MTYPHGGASEIWRDLIGPNTNGLPEGSIHRPDKAEIRDYLAAVEGQLGWSHLQPDQLATTDLVQIHIDPVSGDDMDDGLGWLSPKRTILGAWFSLPLVAWLQTEVIMKAGTHSESPVAWDHALMSGRPAVAHLTGRVCGPRTTRFDDVMAGVVLRGENDVVIDNTGLPVFDETTSFIEAPAYDGGHGVYVTGNTGQVGLAHFAVRPAAAATANQHSALIVSHRQPQRLHGVNVFALCQDKAKLGFLAESGARMEMKNSAASNATQVNWLAIAGGSIDISAPHVDPIMGELAANYDYQASSTGSRIRITTTDNAPPPTGLAIASNGGKFEVQGEGFGSWPEPELDMETRNGHLSVRYAQAQNPITLRGGELALDHCAVEAPIANRGGRVRVGQNVRFTVNTGTADYHITNRDGGIFSGISETTLFTGTAGTILNAEDAMTDVSFAADNMVLGIGAERRHVKVTGGSAARTGTTIGHDIYVVEAASAGFMVGELVSIGGNTVGHVRHVDGVWLTLAASSAMVAAPSDGATLVGATSGHSASISTVKPMTPVGTIARIGGYSWPVTFAGSAVLGGQPFTPGNAAGQVAETEVKWDGANWLRLNWDRS